MTTPAVSVQEPSDNRAQPVHDKTRSSLLRWLELSLVLSVAFAQYFLSSLYSALGGTQHGAYSSNHLVLAHILIELNALAVLWYVLFRQQKNWLALGCSLRALDGLRAIALLVGGSFLGYIIYASGQALHYAAFGEYLSPKDVYALLGMRLSVLSFIFVCVNPFFEELIVRAYTMSEVLALGGSRIAAVAVSVVLQ